jgi:hypothetical protein
MTEPLILCITAPDHVHPRRLGVEPGRPTNHPAGRHGRGGRLAGTISPRTFAPIPLIPAPGAPEKRHETP